VRIIEFLLFPRNKLNVGSEINDVVAVPAVGKARQPDIVSDADSEISNAESERSNESDTDSEDEQPKGAKASTPVGR
jgi:hypothetical protein